MGDPLVGVADTHTHPQAGLGYGGRLKGRDGFPDGGLVWGDASEDDPIKAFPPCDAGSHNGRYRMLGLDTFLPMVGLTDVSRRAVLGLERQGSAKHGPGGWVGDEKDFSSWPHFADGVHLQYHASFIERAYRHGGLRLISALAVNNKLMSRLMLGDRDQGDADAIEKQIDGIHDMVDRHAKWMEIALTPRDVRRIVGQDRLAVVLGVEVDQVEQFFPGERDVKNPGSWVPNLVERLYSRGIRQITPLHFADNSFGGFAIYEDLFNSGNQYATQGGFVEHLLDPDIDFKLEFEQMRFAPGAIPPMVSEKPGYVRSVLGSGHRNKRGLTDCGRALIKELMGRGMIIDVDHMSAETLGNPQCVGALRLAQDKGYPLLSSHTFIRSVAFRDSDGLAWAPNPCTGGAPLRLGPVPSERGLTDDVVDGLGRLGGMICPGTASVGNVDFTRSKTFQKLGFKQTDAPSGSTIAWALCYLLAVEMMSAAGQKSPRVGLATDLTLTPGCGPRFGRLMGARPGLNVSSPRRPAGSRLLYKGDDGAPQDALERHSMGTNGVREFDFNTDGMAHFGLLADFLLDVRRIGLSEEQLKPLYGSAESYVQMWEQCRATMNIRPEDP
jgi:microsomal dipeptidase-like Zn-dependent dipeptidase